MVVWHNGSALVLINEVNLHWARLVMGWVTVSGFNSRCGTFILVCNQAPRSTQPGHPFVGRHNEYQVKDDDALRLGSKSQVWFMCGWQVELCDSLVTVVV